MIRGATYELEVVIKDTDTNTPINLTGVSGILVALYGDGKKIFAKWSYVDKTAEGFGVVTIVNAAQGKISMPIEADDSLKAIEKMAKLEIKVAFPNNMFEDNLQISIDTDIEIERVERSIFEGISAT